MADLPPNQTGTTELRPLTYDLRMANRHRRRMRLSLRNLMRFLPRWG